MPKNKLLDSRQINVDLLLLNLKEKLKLSDEDIMKLSVKEDVGIPVGIFSKEVGMLESLVFYLHGNLGLSFKVISTLLGRDYKTIWTSYNKAKKKK